MMFKSQLFLLASFSVLACSRPQQEASKTGPPPTVDGKRTTTNQKATPVAKVEGEAVAYFAGGCFWGVEHFLEQLPGVLAVESGYMGGGVTSPTYQQVLGKKTGHLETVRVRYRPSEVSYEQLSKRFFEIHDPTQAGGQGADIGPQYRSAVFYKSPEEKQTLQQLIAELQARGFDVVTELRGEGTFWPAEDYHQDYYNKSGKQPYCHARVRRFDKPRIDR